MASRLISSLCSSIREVAHNAVLSPRAIRACLIAVFVLCAMMERAYGGTIEYSVTDLGVLGSGPESFPVAINNLGEVVGYADTYTHYSHAFSV